MDVQNELENGSKVPIPEEKPLLSILKSNLKETFFPDDPFRKFRKQAIYKRILMGLQYFVPIFEWAPRYTLEFLRADVIAGITMASLAVPQGISYANLATLPPLIGLCIGNKFSYIIRQDFTSIVEILKFYTTVGVCNDGSSRDLAIGTVAVASLLFTDILGQVVSPTQFPTEYLHLAFTTTFFAGLFQASLGFLRLGFIVDLLSHATIVGFMGGVATNVCLQQLKGILGLRHFTHKSDAISILKAIFSQTHEWRWQPAILGCFFLLYMMVIRFYGKRKPFVFWMSAMAPLTCVILGSVLVYLTHAQNNGIQVIGYLKKGLNPPSLNDLAFGSPHLAAAIKTGAITAIISLAEGVAVGRSFAMLKNYHINGNKEMLAFGLMNIVGSCTSCYLTTGIFSRTAVNVNAGCETVVSNIIMSISVMITLLLLMPLFSYTPLVVLSSIIINAMLGLIKYKEVIYLWKVDKFDFLICITSYAGVVFTSVENGLIIAVCLSVVRLLLVVATPKTLVLGNIPNTMSYRSIEHYNFAHRAKGILILQIDGPINFACTNYLRERIMRWILEEEDRIKAYGEQTLQHVILDLGGEFPAVGSIDTSGINLLEEVQKFMQGKNLKLLLTNAGSEVMKKMHVSNFIETLGNDYIYSTVAEAVKACNVTPQTSETISIMLPHQINNDEREYNV